MIDLQVRSASGFWLPSPTQRAWAYKKERVETVGRWLLCRTFHRLAVALPPLLYPLSRSLALLGVLVK